MGNNWGDETGWADGGTGRDRGAGRGEVGQSTGNAVGIWPEHTVLNGCEYHLECGPETTVEETKMMATAICY